MNTLIPAWEQQTAEDCRSSSTKNLSKADEGLRSSSRRRISSSLAPWEKQVVTSEQTEFPSNAGGAEELPSGTSLLTSTRLAASTDDDSKTQNHAKDDVEHELESTGDLALKYHYTGNETGDDPQNNHGRRYSRISMIIIYGREALCILALILTTYASIQNR